MIHLADEQALKANLEYLLNKCFSDQLMLLHILVTEKFQFCE